MKFDFFPNQNFVHIYPKVQQISFLQTNSGRNFKKFVEHFLIGREGGREVAHHYFFKSTPGLGRLMLDQSTLPNNDENSTPFIGIVYFIDTSNVYTGKNLPFDSYFAGKNNIFPSFS